MHVFRILLLFVDVSFAEVIAGLHAAGGIDVRGTDGEANGRRHLTSSVRESIRHVMAVRCRHRQRYYLA